MNDSFRNLRRSDMLRLTSGAIASAVSIPEIASAADQSTIWVGIPSNPVTLDPINELNHDAMAATNLIFENLVQVDPDGHLRPQLAKAMPQISSDGLEYLFELRRGVKFHDGSEMTSEDVKYSFDYLLNPANNALRRKLFEPIKEVIAIDKYHVRFVLSTPYRPWMFYLSKYMGIYPKGSREKYGADHFKLSPTGVGTGPGKFVEWKEQDHITIEANRDYWRAGIPKWDRVIVNFVTQDATREAQLLSGNLDIISSPPPRDFQTLKTRPGIVGGAKPTLGGWLFIATNTLKEPFTDVNARRAVACAIDRTLIAQKIYSGLVSPSSIPAPPNGWWFDKNADKINAYNPDLARKLVKQSKYPNGFSFDLEIPATPYLVDVKDAAVAIQQMLKDVGITANIKSYEAAIANNRYFKGEQTATLVVAMSPGEPTYMIELFLDPRGVLSPASGYHNPKLSQMITDSLATTDEAKLKKIFASMLTFCAEQSPFVWLGFVYAADLWRSDIKNFVVNQGLTLLLADVYKEG